MYGYRLWLEGPANIKLNSKESIKSFLQETIRKAGMTLAAGPLIYEEPIRDIGKGPGITGIAILVESNVHIHTYPEQEYFFFELFSCKEFDNKVIADYVKESIGCYRLDVEEFREIGINFPEKLKPNQAL